MGLLQSLKRWWNGAPASDSSLFVEKLAHAFQGRFKLLPYYDADATETTEMRQAYRQMLREPVVKAALLQKVFAVASLDVQVHPAEKTVADASGSDKHTVADASGSDDRNVADFVRHALTSVAGGFPRLAEATLLGALIDGFSVCEKVWARETRGRWAGRIVLHALKAKDPCRLHLETDAFRNVTAIVSTVTQERFDPRHFVLFRYLPLYENPLGTSDLRAAYRAYWLLDTAWKFRGIALERFSLPLMKGTYPRGQSEFVPTLEAAVQTAKSLGYVTLPEGVHLEAMNLAAQSGNDFAAAIRDLRHEVFVGICGAMLQSLEGAVTGARSIGEVHQSTAELLVWHLSAALASAINEQLVPDLVDLNFPEAGCPRVTLGGVNDRELAASLAIDRGLFDMGVPLDHAELAARYGRTASRRSEPPGLSRR